MTDRIKAATGSYSGPCQSNSGGRPPKTATAVTAVAVVASLNTTRGGTDNIVRRASPYCFWTSTSIREHVPWRRAEPLMECSPFRLLTLGT